MSASCEATVRLRVDLHARPAGLVARRAAAAAANVRLAANGQEVDAASVLRVMALGATADTDVVVRAEGVDADDVVADLVALLSGVTPDAVR